MGQWIGIIDIRRYLPLILPFKMPEHVLILLLAGSKHNNLNGILAQLVHHIGNQIKSFLIRQSGHDSDHHGVRILVQIQFFLQRQLILHLFLTEIVDIVILLNMRIRGRIIIIIVNTIHNTGQAVRLGIHQPVKLLTVERHLNLLCIGITYRGHPVRINDTAL